MTQVLRGMPLPERLPSALDAIERHAAEEPDRRAIVFPDYQRTTSRRGLVDAAAHIAGLLRAAGVRRGDLVGVMLRNDERFAPAILATWWVGAAAAPVPIPGAFADVEVFAEHVRAMVAAAGLRHIVYDPSLPGAHTEAAVRGLPGVSWINAGAESQSEQGAVREVIDPSELAVVSYTSGSTSAPKGVELSHANVSAAVAAFAIATGLGPDDAWGIWTPLFHDFALVSMLTALWAGAVVFVWSPTQFIRNPARWLAELGRSGVTHYSGPNFSFDLMRDAATDEALAGVSLDRWRVAVSGGEMVSAATVRRFTERFAEHGFRPETIVPGYGLAEVTLGVSVPALGTAPRVLSVSRTGIADRRRVERVRADDPDARSLVSVGRPFPGMAVRIRDGEVGEIEVSGPSVTRGYRGEPDAAPDGWFRTGDLGFVHEGGLYICGRIKDVVNVRGTKYHPEDLEPIVAEVEGVRKARCCIVGEGETDEQMAVIVETRLRGDELRHLREEIHERLVRRLGMGQVRVHLVEPRTIQVTSNGKVRRQLMRRLLEEGRLRDVEAAVEVEVAL